MHAKPRTLRPPGRAVLCVAPEYPRVGTLVFFASCLNIRKILQERRKSGRTATEKEKCPCCCSPATSKGFFLFPLQFCRFFALSAKFSVYSGTRQKHQSSHFGVSGAVHNIYLPGGRRVRGFVGIEPLVHPCS